MEPLSSHSEPSATLLPLPLPLLLSFNGVDIGRPPTSPTPHTHTQPPPLLPARCCHSPQATQSTRARRERSSSVGRIRDTDRRYFLFSLENFQFQYESTGEMAKHIIKILLLKKYHTVWSIPAFCVYLVSGRSPNLALVQTCLEVFQEFHRTNLKVRHSFSS